jgi:YjjG family noncanonical pyrimidine nucleotidase
MKKDNSSAKKYKCVFFDLDHTLWDYEANSKETLCELFQVHDLSSKGVPDVESFCAQFRTVNLALWDLYDREMINQEYIRKERFKKILEHFFAYDAKLSEDLSKEYLEQCPRKANLIPHALEILEYLFDHYKLTVVTNGFEEIQNCKLSSGNLHRFFNHIVTSQKAGHRKPSQQIFEYAMSANNIKCGDAVMIGDNLMTDIGGARGAQIDTIFFNPDRVNHNEHVSYEIACLSEIRNIL